MRAFCLAAVLLSDAAQGAVLYVSSDKGSDSNSGTSPSTPLRSIHNALAAASSSQDSRVLLSGKFYLNETLNIGSVHAGLVIEQWQGQEEAVLSGGEVIPPSAWSRGADGIWSATVSKSVGTALAAKGTGNIFVNGKARSIVRTETKHYAQPLQGNPTGGFVLPPGDIDPSWNLDDEHVAQWRVAAFHSWTKAFHTVASISNNTLRFKEKASFSYADYTYCSKQRYYIEGIPELPLLPGQWRVDPDAGVGAKLFYSPMHGEQFPDASVVAPVLGTLVALQNTPFVTLQNIVLEHAFGGDCGNSLGIACDRDNALMATNALFASNSKSLRISDVIIRNVGGTAITANVCPGLVIERVGIAASGASGIRVYNSLGALVNNSIVEGYGVRFPAAVGIDLSASPNATVSHCDICCGFYAGLSGGGVNDTAEFSSYTFNHVHDIGSEQEDGICDFSGYHGANGGSVNPIFITSNIFENVTAYANGGGGIYMDVSSAGYQVSRNLVHSVTNSPIIWNINPGVVQRQGPVPTRITNNVLIADRDSDYYRKLANGTRGAFHFWGQGNPVFSWIGHTSAELERNVMVVDTSRSPSRGEWFSGRPCAKDNAESSECTWEFEDNFKKLESRNNVWYNASSPFSFSTSMFPGGCNVTGSDSWKECGSDCTCRSWTEWREFGQETSSLWVDPGLTGPLKLVSEPKVLALGIEPLHELARAGADWKLPTAMPSPEELYV